MTRNLTALATLIALFAAADANAHGDHGPEEEPKKIAVGVKMLPVGSIHGARDLDAEQPVFGLKAKADLVDFSWARLSLLAHWMQVTAKGLAPEGDGHDHGGDLVDVPDLQITGKLKQWRIGLSLTRELGEIGGAHIEGSLAGGLLKFEFEQTETIVVEVTGQQSMLTWFVSPEVHFHKDRWHGGIGLLLTKGTMSFTSSLGLNEEAPAWIAEMHGDLGFTLIKPKGWRPGLDTEVGFHIPIGSHGVATTFPGGSDFSTEVTGWKGLEGGILATWEL